MGRAEERGKWVRVWVCAWLAVLAGWSVCLGIVVHPEGDSGPVERPGDGVVGRWGSNGSCVAVGSEWVLTTRHQGGGVGTPVAMGGVGYVVAAVVNEPSADGRSADLRLARLERVGGGAAGLTEWVGVYEGAIGGTAVVMGGYGAGRGAAYSDEHGRGYLWEAGSGGVLRWGTNVLDNWVSESMNGYWSSIVRVRFDGAGATGCEGAVAAGDSGGGWFVASGGGWEVAALSSHVQYGDPDGSGPLPGASRYEPAEGNYGIWLGAYAGWIRSVVGGRPVGDVTGDWVVDLADVAAVGEAWLRVDCEPGNGWCGGADLDGDGGVDFWDAAVVLGGWSERREERTADFR